MTKTMNQLQVAEPVIANRPGLDPGLMGRRLVRDLAALREPLARRAQSTPGGQIKPA